MTSTTTQTMSVADVTAEAYASADVATKARMRAVLKSGLHAAVAAGDIGAAQAIMATEATLTATKAATKVAVNYADVLASRVAVLRHAADLLESGAVRPDGFPEGDLGTVSGPAPSDIDAATKLATSKLTKSSDRSDVGAAIQSAFDGLDADTFLTVAQIANKAGLPSQGAVAARLFPKSGECTVSGIVPVAATATSPKGAKKA